MDGGAGLIFISSGLVYKWWKYYGRKAENTLDFLLAWPKKKRRGKEQTHPCSQPRRPRGQCCPLCGGAFCMDALCLFPASPWLPCGAQNSEQTAGGAPAVVRAEGVPDVGLPFPKCPKQLEPGCGERVGAMPCETRGNSKLKKRRCSTGTPRGTPWRASHCLTMTRH